MAKFVLLEKAPDNVGKDEIVIAPPTFLDEIKASSAKASGRKMTSLHHLRQITTLIGQKYDPEGFNPFAGIPFSKFEGLPFTKDSELSDIVVRMLARWCPSMLDKVIEYQIKNRPSGTKVIYFLGPQEQTGIFFKHGIARADLKEVQAETGGKKSKKSEEA